MITSTKSPLNTLADMKGSKIQQLEAAMRIRDNIIWIKDLQDIRNIKGKDLDLDLKATLPHHLGKEEKNEGIIIVLKAGKIIIRGGEEGAVAHKVHLPHQTLEEPEEILIKLNKILLKS